MTKEEEEEDEQHFMFIRMNGCLPYNAVYRRIAKRLSSETWQKNVESSVVIAERGRTSISDKTTVIRFKDGGVMKLYGNWTGYIPMTDLSFLK